MQITLNNNWFITRNIYIDSNLSYLIQVFKIWKHQKVKIKRVRRVRMKKKRKTTLINHPNLLLKVRKSKKKSHLPKNRANLKNLQLKIINLTYHLSHKLPWPLRINHLNLVIAFIIRVLLFIFVKHANSLFVVNAQFTDRIIIMYLIADLVASNFKNYWCLQD